MEDETIHREKTIEREGEKKNEERLDEITE